MCECKRGQTKQVKYIVRETSGAVWGGKWWKMLAIDEARLYDSPEEAMRDVYGSTVVKVEVTCEVSEVRREVVE